MRGVHRHRETGPGCDLGGWPLCSSPSRPGRILSLPSRTLGASIDWLSQRAIVATPSPLNERPAGVGPRTRNATKSRSTNGMSGSTSGGHGPNRADVMGHERLRAAKKIRNKARHAAPAAIGCPHSVQEADGCDGGSLLRGLEARRLRGHITCGHNSPTACGELAC
jgi:hypothetical protein